MDTIFRLTENGTVTSDNHTEIKTDTDHYIEIQIDSKGALSKKLKYMQKFVKTSKELSLRENYQHILCQKGYFVIIDGHIAIFEKNNLIDLTENCKMELISDNILRIRKQVGWNAPTLNFIDFERQYEQDKQNSTCSIDITKLTNFIGALPKGTKIIMQQDKEKEAIYVFDHVNNKNLLGLIMPCFIAKEEKIKQLDMEDEDDKSQN